VPADGAPALLIVENEFTDGGREMLPLPLPFLGPSLRSVVGWGACAPGAPFLIESADVDVVSFTGSTEVGRLIAAAGARTLKRMKLELGGKTPMIVFDDAALASTLPILAACVTTFAGQNCMAGSRILVQRGIAAST
jgi:acyl-CoA reductase-like NAD-dependent aldehyde dehydrogenase